MLILHLLGITCLLQVWYKADDTSAGGDYQDCNDFNEKSLDADVVSTCVLAIQVITRADLPSMRESQHEEVDPNEDFDETAHCVEENSHLENWLGIILVFHSFGNRVGEERDDSLTDSHKE